MLLTYNPRGCTSFVSSSSLIWFGIVCTRVHSWLPVEMETLVLRRLPRENVKPSMHLEILSISLLNSTGLVFINEDFQIGLENNPIFPKNGIYINKWIYIVYKIHELEKKNSWFRLKEFCFHNQPSNILQVLNMLSGCRAGTLLNNMHEGWLEKRQWLNHQANRVELIASLASRSLC